MRLLVAFLAALSFAAPAAAQTVLIRDGRVVTNGAPGIIEGGDVLIVDGRIRAVGANVAAPAGARVIEAQGRFVTPGGFAAMSEIGLSEISGSGTVNDASVSGDLIAAAADAGRAFNPGVTAIAVTRMEGVTRAAIAPSQTATMFGGRGALVGNLSLITEALLAYVEANQTTDYLLVVGSAMQGAPLVLETGQPVLYLGGFNGSDAIYTEADLAQMVAEGEVRFFLTGISSFDRWVVDTCRLVEAVSINVTMPGGGMRPPAGGFPGGFAPPALYDCQMTG